jgi:hypothetical protein
MQILLGLVIIVTMCRPLIKLIIGLPYGIFWLIVAVLIWRSCLK